MTNIYIHYQNVCGRKSWQMLTYIDWLLPIKSHDHITMRSCKITWQTKIIISINTMSLAINLSRLGIQWRFPFHKVTRAFDHVVLQVHVKYFSCFITTVTRTMATKLVKWYLALRNFNPLSHTSLWTCGHVRLLNKLKTIYLYYYNTYGHQTW